MHILSIERFYDKGEDFNFSLSTSLFFAVMYLFLPLMMYLLYSNNSAVEPVPTTGNVINETSCIQIIIQKAKVKYLKMEIELHTYSSTGKVKPVATIGYTSPVYSETNTT